MDNQIETFKSYALMIPKPRNFKVNPFVHPLTKLNALLNKTTEIEEDHGYVNVKFKNESGFKNGSLNITEWDARSVVIVIDRDRCQTAFDAFRTDKVYAGIFNSEDPVYVPIYRHSSYDEQFQLACGLAAFLACAPTTDQLDALPNHTFQLDAH